MIVLLDSSRNWSNVVIGRNIVFDKYFQ